VRKRVQPLSFFILSLAISVVSIGIGGCQPPAEEASSAGKGAPAGAGDGAKRLQIAMIPKGTTHIFWRSVHFGALKAAEELGVDVQWRGPQKESDRDEQISLVQGFVNKQVDGICLAPLDADALVGPVKEAGRGGVPVVIFDSGLKAESDAFASYVATDNFRGGELAAKALADKLGGKGNVVMLRYNQGSESTHQREEGFLKGIAAYPEIKVLSGDQYAGTTTESSMDKAQQMLNRYGDEIDGIFAVCEPNAEGVLRALEDRQLAGKVAFVGFDSSEAMADALRAGKLSAIVLQDPVQMGYLAIRSIVQAIRGEQVEGFVDTGVYVATPENIDSDQIKKLLFPDKA
jgi:ribose transport system substrate-binding protein